MDLNIEYAAHQQALMSADNANNDEDRLGHLARASIIAARISAFQQNLGAAAACAWSASRLATTART